jgi:hypothetical protein
MAIAASPIRRILIGILPSALFVLVGFIAYLYQSHAKADFQSSRSFRALMMMGSQIQSRLDAQEAVFIRTGKVPATGEPLVAPITFHSSPMFAPALRSKDWTVDLDKIVGPLMRLDVFDSVMVARQDGGEVLVQDPKMLFRIVNLSALFEARVEGAKADGKTPSAVSEKMRGTEMAPRSDAFPMRMGDEYMVYLHPISLRQKAANESKGVRLVLVGMTKKPDLTLASLWNPAYVEPGFWFVILLLAGWPLQKIFNLTPGQRFRRRDGLLFLICGMALTSMLTCLLLDFYYDSVWDSETDRQLRETANQISRNFNAELNSAYDNLVGFDDQMQQEARDLRETCLKLPDDHEASGGRKLVNVLVDRPEFPFETAEWLNQYGIQRIKWTIRGQVNSFGQRKDRDYFKDLKHGHLPGVAGKHFSLQRLYSWDDGQDLTVMGIAMDSQHPCLTTRVGGLHAISVGSIVLPPNLQFAVVDAAGLVLYHTDATRVHVENFANECERTREVVAAHVRMAARKECTEASSRECATFEAEYDGRSRRMYVQALDVEALPWSVIVFADASILEKQEGGVLRLALLFLFAYAFTIAALLFLLYVNRRKWWVTPPWSEVPARLAALFAFLLCAIVWFALLIVSPQVLIAFCGAFFCPIVGIAAAAIALTAKFSFLSG